MTFQPDAGMRVEILTPRDASHLPLYKHLVVRKVGTLSGQAWEQFDLPSHAKGRLLFTPCGAAPIMHAANVLTIHDAAVFSTPQAYSLKYRLWYKCMHRLLSRTCLHILTVSEFSKSELVRYCRIVPSKITVTCPGSEQMLKQVSEESILDRNGLRSTPYVLGVCSLQANKNIKGFLRAAEYLAAENKNIKFALAGDTNNKVFTSDFQFPPAIKLLGYVTDGELRALYANAACFVFPSFYEGFGLPPLEAMSLGCPVVAANTASLPEVLGDKALYCDPSDPADIARQVRRALSGVHPDPAALVAHASQYSYSRCAKETWSILRAACSR